MSEEAIIDDQSHYEVSLTAGQAFLAFVLLLLSLAASFAFGLMIGKGQGDERLLAQGGPSIVNESRGGADPQPERLGETAVADGTRFSDTDTRTDAAPVRRSTPAPKPAAPSIKIREEAQPAAAVSEPAPAAAAPAPSRAAAAGPAVPHYAQLLSTTDQAKAEAFAARLINGGFMSAYVERGSNAKGPLFRVRVNFRSEQDARAAEPKLKTFSPEVWITKQ